MAKLNGVEIKNIKKYVGHEGESCVQGTVYLDGKKLGFWSQDGHGGPDNFDFPVSLLKERVLKAKSILSDKGVKKTIYDTEIFMCDLLTLKDIETSIKKYQKAGYTAFLVGFVVGGNGFAFKCFYNKEDITHSEYEEVKKTVIKSETFDGSDGYKTILVTSLEDLSLELGTDEGLAQEELRLAEKQGEEQKKKDAYEQQLQYKKDKIASIKRFEVQPVADMPRYLVKDTETGKMTEVPNFALNDVLFALAELFEE